MKQSIWNVRIPTFVAIILLLTGLGATIYLVRSGIITIGRAATDTLPENIAITNITDTSFTVAFNTKSTTNAFLNYSENNDLTSTIFDTRDKNESPNAYYAHEIQITNLTPNTTYNFEINVNGTKIRKDDKPFTVATGKKIDEAPVNKSSIFGKVVLPDGSPAQDSLVFIAIENIQPLSALTNEKGEYSISLNMARTPLLDEYGKLQNNTPINIQIIRDGLSSQIITLYEKSQEIPTVMLSKNYDFQKDLPVINDTNDLVDNGLQIPPPPGSIQEKITISSPKDDASLIDQQPLFQGTALPNETVKITVESENPLVTSVTTDRNGRWSYRPAEPLTSGEHTITIETKDQFGIIKRIKQNFSVYAQGSQLSLTSSPTPTPRISPTPTTISQNLTPTPTSSVQAPTPSKTPTPTTFGALTPTLQLSPTATISQTPTATPTINGLLSPTPSNLILTPSPTLTFLITLTPTISQAPTPTEAPGAVETTILLTFGAVLLIITGIVFLAF